MKARSSRKNPVPRPFAYAMEISFITTWKAEAWKPLVEGLGMAIAPVSWADWNARGSALPEDFSPGAKFLRAEAHHLKSNPEAAHWLINFEVVKTGVPHLSLVAERWGGARPEKADLKVRYSVSANERSGKVFMQRGSSTFVQAKKRLSIDHQLVGWVIEEGDARTQMGVYSQPNEDQHVVTVEWKGGVTLGPALGPSLEEEAWTRVSSIFSSRRKTLGK